MRDEPWQTFHIKDTHKGPLLWQVKATRFRYSVRQEDSHRHLTLPSTPCWLIHAQNMHTQEIKYFVSNAPAGTPTETLLHVAFSRWHVERLFEDDKGQLGLADFECRRWQAIHRHFVLSTISHLLLSRLRLQLESAGGKKGLVTAAASSRRHRVGLSKSATFSTSAAV